jgi:hypothetical protein
MLTGGGKLEMVLKGIAERAGKPGTVRVGFLEGATYPDGTSVATVAAIQNYGAPGANIPARPFFSNMVKEKSPNWGKSLGQVLVAANYDATLALGRMGEGIKGQLEQAILDTTSPPLAKETVDAKGFSKPLEDTGHMLDSVGFEVKE